MKFRMFATLMIALLMMPLLTGCSLWTLDARIEAVEEVIDNRLDAAEAAVEAAVLDAMMPEPAAAPAPAAEPSAPAYDPPAAEAPAAILTKEEAEAIALEHAQLTGEQLLYLHTELDYDDGRREYNVEFQLDRWEYDYEIHAENGQILSWDKDWDD